MTLLDTPEAADAALRDAPKHHRLYTYWRTRAAGRRAPSRADIDPLDLPDLLADIWLMDVLENPPTYKVRLAGTGIRAIIGRDITGLTFDEVFSGPEGAAVRSEYDRVVESWSPHLVERTVGWAARTHLTYRRLVLPLSADGLRVDMLLGLSEERPTR